MILTIEQLIEELQQYNGKQSAEPIIIQYVVHMMRGDLQFTANLVNQVAQRLALDCYVLQQDLRLMEEKAINLEIYLHGDMYNSPEAAEAHKPIQEANAVIIKDIAKKYARKPQIL